MASDLGAKKRERSVEDPLECPVCFESLRPTSGVRRTRGGRRAVLPVTWPCGHVVCNACDKRMKETNHHRCAVCRTLREGFTEEDAELASRVRVLSDAAHATLGTDGAGAGVGTVMRHGGRSYEVIFFANQSTGDPFEGLRAAAEAGVRVVGTTAFSSGPINLAEADSDGLTGRVVHARHLNDVTEAEIPSGMSELIRELLRPTSVEIFLARRSAVRETQSS